MAQFTYMPILRGREISVRCDGRVTGTIRSSKGGGYHYKPKGSKVFGDTFPTIKEVKRSIEGGSMPLSLVKTRELAYPFDDESDVRLACMEARDGTGGVCAGEKVDQFRYERLEGETGTYVVYTDLAGQTFYLTRGVR